MTPNEIKLAWQIFQILPTFTAAILIAVAYIKWQNAEKKREDRLLGMEMKIENNSGSIVQIAKIHLKRHPDDAGEFLKEELLERKDI